MTSFIYPSYLRNPQNLGVIVFRGGELPIPPHYEEGEIFTNIWDEVEYVRSLTDTQLAVYLSLIRAAVYANLNDE